MAHTETLRMPPCDFGGLGSGGTGGYRLVRTGELEVPDPRVPPPPAVPDAPIAPVAPDQPTPARGAGYRARARRTSDPIVPDGQPGLPAAVGVAAI